MMVKTTLSFFLSFTLSNIYRAVYAGPALRHRKLQPSTTNAIPGQYIIELYPNASPQQATSSFTMGVQSTMEAEMPEIVHTYENVMNGFTVKNLADSELSLLLNNPHVKAVWQVSNE
jgi:hypothetical protein